LAEQGVPVAKLNQLPSGLQGVFPVRSIRAGRPTYLFRAQDSSLAYWVYSHTPSVYLKIDLQGDSLHATLDTLATTRTVRLLHATIESSLWNAMVQAGAKPEVALVLSDIFAWTVDFFALGKGDHELGFIEPGIGIERREHTGGGWSRGENTLIGCLAQLTVPGAGHTEDGATPRGPLVGLDESPFRQAFEDVVDG